METVNSRFLLVGGGALLALLAIPLSSQSARGEAMVPQDPPPKKCPANPPTEDESCGGGLGQCSGAGGVSNITCSTQQEGECEPADPDIPCRWSCTLTVNGDPGDQFCVGGAGGDITQCASPLVSIPSGGSTTLSPPPVEVDCFDTKHFKILRFDVSGNFICCEQVSFTCGKCN